jgi:hypothetical protein
LCRESDGLERARRVQDGKASVVGVGLAGLPEPELAQVNGSVPAYLTR